MSVDSVLRVDALQTVFVAGKKETIAVENVSFSLEKGKTLGIVGESGSGKSVTALSIMRLIQRPGLVRKGQVWLQQGENEQDLLSLTEKEMQRIRGKAIGMIFQEPMSSLNPVHRCGDQVSESLRLHLNLDRASARKRTLEWFDQVQLPRVEELYQAYPHQLSGGQKQRVMIAMALCCQPDVLIADEPTTALDVTVQKEILELLRNLRDEHQMAMMFITHDLGVVAEIADNLLVMKQGEVVESGEILEVFSQPRHPYTQGLLACRPPLERQIHRLPTVADFMRTSEAGEKLPDLVGKEIGLEEQHLRQQQLSEQPPLLEVDDLQTWFPVRKGLFSKVHEQVKAVDGVSFEVFRGETLGLVGESGCGKTTLGRSILRLIEPTGGSIRYHGKELIGMKSQELRALRKEIQIIFQDPFSSLNPRMTIGRAIAEPMTVHGLGTNGADRKERVIHLLEQVGLSGDHFHRYPHEFSGGQRQRICIARALAVEPSFIICDESVSALDVSVQAQVLNLLKDLQVEKQLTYIFISHDLNVVKFMSDRMMVMQAGKIVESGPAEQLYQSPQTAYTQELIAAIPIGSLDRIKTIQQLRHK